MQEVVAKAQADFQRTVAAQQAVLLAEMMRLEKQRSEQLAAVQSAPQAVAPPAAAQRQLTNAAPAGEATPPVATPAVDDRTADELRAILARISEVEANEDEVLSRWVQVDRQRTSVLRGAETPFGGAEDPVPAVVADLSASLELGPGASLVDVATASAAPSTTVPLGIVAGMDMDAVPVPAAEASVAPSPVAGSREPGAFVTAKRSTVTLRSSFMSSASAAAHEAEVDVAVNTSALEEAILRDILAGRDRYLKCVSHFPTPFNPHRHKQRTDLGWTSMRAAHAHVRLCQRSWHQVPCRRGSVLSPGDRTRAVRADQLVG